MRFSLNLKFLFLFFLNFGIWSTSKKKKKKPGYFVDGWAFCTTTVGEMQYYHFAQFLAPNLLLLLLLLLLFNEKELQHSRTQKDRKICELSDNGSKTINVIQVMHTNNKKWPNFLNKNNIKRWKHQNKRHKLRHDRLETLQPYSNSKRHRQELDSLFFLFFFFFSKKVGEEGQ